MTILLQNRRRLSALLDQFKNWKSLIRNDSPQYRSLSTGDLVSKTTENDLHELNFRETPTTSLAPPLPAHFDDTDLVPVDFSSKTPKLMAQGSKNAGKVKKFGSLENLADIHRSKSWFFVDLDPKSAERILCSDGFISGSFLISFYQKRYVLSVWKSGKVEHLVIRNYLKKNGSQAFQLDLDKNFRNLVELTDYYQKNKSFVLCSKLSKGVGRPRRNNQIRSRA